MKDYQTHKETNVQPCQLRPAGLHGSPTGRGKQIAVKATRSLGQNVLVIDLAEAVETDAVEAADSPEMDESIPEKNGEELE